MQVPPHGKGSLYIRPLLTGSGPVLGIAPAPECSFMIFTSPIGNYYKVRFPFKTLNCIWQSCYSRLGPECVILIEFKSSILVRAG